MKRRTFVVTSTISLLAIAIAVAGFAFFSDFAARAFVQDLPSAVHYLPADTQAVFGMNVQRFVSSPVYTLLMQKHGEKIASDLDEFTAKTGVNPTQDIRYIVGAARPSSAKDSGVVIAVGNFNPASITEFISSHATPVRLDYKGCTVLMIPEADYGKTQKGVAFLANSEIALGDLESLQAVIDARNGSPTIQTNPLLMQQLDQLNAADMFWFAGTAGSILSKLPANTPYVQTFSTVQSVFGTLNLMDPVTGRITVTAADGESAKKLAEFATGLLALGQLAGAKNPDMAALVQGVQITQRPEAFDVSVNFPLSLIEKLDAAKTGVMVK